ncbi:MAG: M20/M25/M40 family metallo-hydrolase [Kyrpidia sp.]|nr:M20/M25/M40 family metallo-hydrolase [Kyrpidia sp.]
MEDRVVKEFLQLVGIRSPSRGERRMADYVRRRLRGLGAQVTEDKAGWRIRGNAGNVMARIPGDRDRAPLLFVAHLDTVGGGHRVRPRVQGDRIVGDGIHPLGADDKAGVAVLLETVRVLREGNISHAPLELLFTVCEEEGLLGARHFDTGQLQARYGFVFDAAGPVGTAVLRSPAQAVVRGAFAGLAGRWPGPAGDPGRAAAEAVSAMRLGRPEPGIRARIVGLGGTRGRDGGTMYLTAEALGYNPGRLWKQMERMGLCVRMSAQTHRIDAEVRASVLYPAMELTPSDPVVALFRRAAEDIGVTVRYREAMGGSDANVLNSRGLPAITLGVGYEHSHSPRESVGVRALGDAVRLALSLAVQEG